jgi:hypothetical protein
VTYYYEGARRSQPRHLRFTNNLRGHTVCLYEDNQAVVVIIKNRTSFSPLLMNELCLLMLEQLDIL